MPKPASHRVALHWTRPCLSRGRLLILLGCPALCGALGTLLLLLSSCDDIGRHSALTFFFDGVPPLPGTVAQTESSVSSDTKVRGPQPVENWRTHEPVRDCTTCHGKQPRRGASPKVQLVASIPSLCYQCHKEYVAPDGWVHGPVATGDCLLCHEPHKTKTESLLRKTVPELCYSCHETQAIRAVPNHAELADGRCIDCHAAHAAETKNLLKPAFLNTPAGWPYQIAIHQRRYEDPLQRAHLSMALSSSFDDMCRTIIDFIESDQLLLAQAYLEVLGDSQLPTDREKPVVKEALQQVIALQKREARKSGQDRESEAVLKAARQTVAATLRALRGPRAK